MKIRVFILGDTISAITPMPMVELATPALNQQRITFGGSAPAQNLPGFRYCDLDTVEDLGIDIDQVGDQQLRHAIADTLRQRNDISIFPV